MLRNLLLAINSINKYLMSNRIEAGIRAHYVLICVVKPIGVDAKSENVTVSQN